MRIAFRVDASREIGTGHLMRCLTLANALREEGAHCEFLCRDQPLTTMVEEAGHVRRRLPAEPLSEAADAEACRKLLGEPVDWLLVDHYGLGSGWERALQPAARRLAVIDDLADRPHAVDLLLDQNELPDRERRYEGLLPDHCRRLFGARHALLRPEFARPVTRERDGRLRRLLVNFGGTDPGNTTGLALDALEQLGWADRTVDVVAGRLHPALDSLGIRCGTRPGWTLHVQSPRIAELMDASDLALAAGGTSTWERCARGLPSVILSIADNQRPLAAATAESGAALWPGDAAEVTPTRLATLLQALDQCPSWLRSMSQAARRLCDGRGTGRVSRALLGPELRLRPASAVDESLTLEWRNHPEVRRHSGDGRPITAESHHAWFSKIIADSDRALLIAESLDRPLAVVRFDGLAGGEPELSIYLDPARLGLGWGREVLQAAAGWLRARTTARAIRARIHPGNRASQSAFRDAGYQPQTQWWTLCL